MKKMFTGHKYNQTSKNKPISDEETLNLKELERFYNKVKDVQLAEIRKLIVELSNENKNNLDQIILNINNCLNSDIIDKISLYLKNSKETIQTSIDKNNYNFNKRLERFEKYLTIALLTLAFLLIPNIVTIFRWLYNLFIKFSFL